MLTGEELDLQPIEDVLASLKRRNLSFIMAYVDHNEFNKSKEEGIVWACESGGNLVLQESLRRFLNRWLGQVVTVRTSPVHPG